MCLRVPAIEVGVVSLTSYTMARLGRIPTQRDHQLVGMRRERLHDYLKGQS